MSADGQTLSVYGAQAEKYATFAGHTADAGLDGTVAAWVVIATDG